jgi:hypothetical protein
MESSLKNRIDDELNQLQAREKTLLTERAALVEAGSAGRREIGLALRRAGYEIVEQTSDISDPFAWKLIARLGEYEIRIEERARALVGA